MSDFQNILIVLDVYNDFRDNPEHQPTEVKKALELVANRDLTQLYLVGCGFEEYLHDTYSNFGPEAVEHRKRFVAEMEQRLEVVAKGLIDQGYKVDSRVHWTYPRYEQITKEALELDVDLVVQHAHMRQPHERHNLSHDSWQLIKSCPKPLLLTKDKDWAPQPVILATVDPVHSHHKPQGLDHKIIDTALQIGELVKGSVHVMHAYSESARPFLAKGSMHEKHETEFKRLLADYEIPDHSVHLLDETPTNAIVHCQETLHADITVIGALSRSRLAEAIVGNTANRVLDYVKSDLLIMHPG